MSKDISDLRSPERISRATLAHYGNAAQSYWEHTLDHDVSQNITALLDAIEGPGGYAILDLGCGPGRDLRAFRALGHEAVGLDGCREFVAMARAYSGCEVLHQDFLAMDLRMRRFDGVFANAALFHVPSRELARVLGDLRAALKPRGVLFSSNPRGKDEEGWSGDEILLTYSIAQFVFAFSTILSGKLVDTRGPRLTITIGGLLFGGGLILSSFATSPWMLWVTFGVIVGSGVGFVYVCPIATLVKWFPDKKGTITGLAVGVFGGGSIIFKDVIDWLIQGSDVSTAFWQLGVLTAVIIVLGAQLTSNPPGYTKATATKGAKDFTTAEMVKTPTFFKTWVMYWLAVVPGLLVLGAAKNIGLEVAGLEELALEVLGELALVLFVLM